MRRLNGKCAAKPSTAMDSMTLSAAGLSPANSAAKGNCAVAHGLSIGDIVGRRDRSHIRPDQKLIPSELTALGTNQDPEHWICGSLLRDQQQEQQSKCRQAETAFLSSQTHFG